MKNKTILILIFLLAFILRFSQLGQNPASLDWDEASLGYNAYSLLKTRRDEYGSFLPLSIRSFNDHKPPLYTYLTMIPVYLFGLNEFSTRFISALSGALTVIVVYFLARELFPKKFSLFFVLCSLFFAISPWHIQFSRVAFEANLALFFFILGTWLFVKAVKKDSRSFLLSLISFGLTCYAYHSPRLIVPVFLFGLILIYRREIIKKIVPFLTGVFILGLMLFPLVRQFGSATGMRLSSVTVLNPDERLGPSIKAIEFDQERGDFLGRLMHNRRIVYGREVLGGYLDHFNFDFLFLTGDPPGRHHAAGMSMLYFWDLPFVLIGIVYLFNIVIRDYLKRSSSWQVGREGILVIFWWFLVAPLASSLTTGTPHAVRALFYLPTYQIFAAFGVYQFIQFWQSASWRSQSCKSEARNTKSETNPNDQNPKSKMFWLFENLNFNIVPPQRDPAFAVISNLGFRISNLGRYIFIFIICFSLSLNIFYYLHMYYIHTPIEYAKEWQYGYKEMVEEVNKLEDGYDRIIVTYHYDQPYVYFLFYGKIDPSWYQENWGQGEIKRAERKFGKYEFRNIDWDRDSRLTNVVLVGTAHEIPETASGLIKEIKFPDGTVAFRIAAR